MRPVPCVAVSLSRGGCLTWPVDLAPALAHNRAVTEVAKKIGEQWKTLSDKEKKVRQFELSCCSMPPSSFAVDRLSTEQACRARPPASGPPHVASPSGEVPAVTVAWCYAAQKYNDKAEKDKARYASEMKKCDPLHDVQSPRCASAIYVAPALARSQIHSTVKLLRRCCASTIA